MSADTARNDEDVDLEDDWSDLSFVIRVSIRYHLKRENWWLFWNRTATALSLLFSSATFFVLFRHFNENLIAGFAAAITLLTTLELVVGFQSKAQYHRDLMRRFMALRKNMERGDKPKTQETLGSLKAERFDIEAEELHTKRVLYAICHNEEIVAEDSGQEDLVRVRWWQKMFCHLADIFPDSLQKETTGTELA